MSRHAPNWKTDGLDWPNRRWSRFVSAAGHRWHLQDAGSGPVMLLLHGTAASTHSWANLLPLLAGDVRVLAPDLTGHGFTDLPDPARLGLDAMAADIGALLESIGAAPVLAVGHSAGATILARMILDRRIGPKGLVVLNHSLTSPFHPTAAVLAAAAARVARAPMLARLAAGLATPEVVERRLRSTGSILDPAAVDRYTRLLGSRRHVAAALGMMSRWNLDALESALPGLVLPVLFIAGEHDNWFRPERLAATAARLAHATATTVRATGHLSHEERPETVAELILTFARSTGAIAPAG
jgi:putative magnesium chelatase accessory protein